MLFFSARPATADELMLPAPLTSHSLTKDETTNKQVTCLTTKLHNSNPSLAEQRHDRTEAYSPGGLVQKPYSCT